METCIPFSGFYNSLWDSEIDSCQEQDVEYYCEEHPDVDKEEYSELLFKHADYHACQLKIAEAYVDAFQDWINSAHNVDIRLTWKEMTSPKEYNFTTDRIFVGISYEDVKTMIRAVGWKAVASAARDLFTSRSGFISFYDPDITTWGKVALWDCNQCLAIFVAATRGEDYDLSIYYDLTEKIYQAWQECVDWKHVEYDLEHMNDEPDGRNYPINLIDPKAYVETFIEKNRYTK